MARGITQSQVDIAADALLQRGERPTIEKVRSELGTGSPNTLTRLLEAWWAGLSERLAAQARANVPGLPESVQRAVMTLWSEAALAARALAQAEIVERESQVIAQRDEDQRIRDAAAASERARQREIAQLVLDRESAEAQRDAEHRRANEQQSANTQIAGSVAALQTTLAEVRREAEIELGRLRLDLDRANAAEQRWLLEVDRSREETKVAQRAAKAITADLDRERARHTQNMERLQAERRDLQQALVKQRRALKIAERAAIVASRKKVPVKPATKRASEKKI
jgi:hypothetical protein